MLTPPAPAELTAKEQKKLNRLRDLKQKLERGEHVQNRALATWLGKEAVADIEHRWQGELDARAELEHKPPEIKEYERRLKQANFTYAKAEGASERHKKYSGKFYNKSDDHYERVLEYIQGEISVDPSLQDWLDRPAIYEAGDVGTGPDYSGMPRVITSRSAENQSDGSMHGTRITKRACKLEAVDQAINALENKVVWTPEHEAAQSANLKDMLAKLKAK